MLIEKFLNKDELAAIAFANKFNKKRHSVFIIKTKQEATNTFTLNISEYDENDSECEVKISFKDDVLTVNDFSLSVKLSKDLPAYKVNARKEVVKSLLKAVDLIADKAGEFGELAKNKDVAKLQKCISKLQSIYEKSSENFIFPARTLENHSQIILDTLSFVGVKCDEFNCTSTSKVIELSGCKFIDINVACRDLSALNDDEDDDFKFDVARILLELEHTEEHFEFIKQVLSITSKSEQLNEFSEELKKFYEPEFRKEFIQSVIEEHTVQDDSEVEQDSFKL